MGLYKKKGSPFYWMYYRVSNEGKHESTKTTNKKLAEKIYAKRITEVAEDKWFPNEARKRTFQELIDKYMKEHSRVYKTEKSTVRDKTSFKHLKEHFGNVTLIEITPSSIAEYKSLRKTKGAKPATLARELEVLRHALNLAVREWEWLDRNPFERVKIDKVENKVERWLASDEETALLRVSPPWLQQIITFALHTGARQDEILSLKWTEVDLQRKVVMFLKTKNKEKRTIPLNQRLVSLLQEKRRVQSISGYVFVSQGGTKVNARNLLRAFYKARKATHLEDVRFHDLNRSSPCENP